MARWNFNIRGKESQKKCIVIQCKANKKKNRTHKISTYEQSIFRIIPRRNSSVYDSLIPARPRVDPNTHMFLSSSFNFKKFSVSFIFC